MLYQEYKNWVIWQPSPTPFLEFPFRNKRYDLRSLEPENDTTNLQKSKINYYILSIFLSVFIFFIVLDSFWQNSWRKESKIKKELTICFFSGKKGKMSISSDIDCNKLKAFSIHSFGMYQIKHRWNISPAKLLPQAKILFMHFAHLTLFNSQKRHFWWLHRYLVDKTQLEYRVYNHFESCLPSFFEKS